MAFGSTKLHDVGIEVQVAGNGRQGAELLTSFDPDVIVLDLLMPEVNGFKFLEGLRSNPASQHIPVIVLAGKNLEPGDSLKLAEYGAAVLTKADVDNRIVVETVSIAAAIARRTKGPG